MGRLSARNESIFLMYCNNSITLTHKLTLTRPPVDDHEHIYMIDTSLIKEVFGSSHEEGVWIVSRRRCFDRLTKRVF